ncbi:MAG: hypothetical protein QOJ35_537 [Solirubrobacteraceae bacterium]|nr:hypothetical protein [Solirubrobacteraceae bacterium]
MPIPTGNPNVDAATDFQRARRRRVLARLAARLRGEPGDVQLILPFEEVVAALGYLGERQLGLRRVRLDSIVGTVDRTRDFDRSFRPTSSRVRRRWERINTAQRRGEAMPPISLYKIGELHFVRDGHHRVSVARVQGQETIAAEVVEIITTVSADSSMTLADLPMKSHERVFHERVTLPHDALARIELTDPVKYGKLAEMVEAWGYRLIQRDERYIDRPQTALRWFHEEYVPVVAILRDADLIGRRETETEAYMRLSGERYRIMTTHEWSDEAIERVRRGR